MNIGFIPLDVDHRIKLSVIFVIQDFQDLMASFGPAPYQAGSHDRPPPEIVDMFFNAIIICRHDYLRKLVTCRGLFINPSDHRFTIDHTQWFAGKAVGSKTSRNYAKD